MPDSQGLMDSRRCLSVLIYGRKSGSQGKEDSRNPKLFKAGNLPEERPEIIPEGGKFFAQEDSDFSYILRGEADVRWREEGFFFHRRGINVYKNGHKSQRKDTAESPEQYPHKGGLLSFSGEEKHT